MKPERRADVQVREIGGEWVVLDRQNGLIHQLNSSAGFVWNCCDGCSATPEIATRMSEKFGIAMEQAMQDVVAVLEKFIELGLLKSGSNGQ